MSNVRDVKRPPVKITLPDGKERELRYSLNALAYLEEKYGSVDDAFKAVDKGSIRGVRCVLYAGLMDSDPELTELKVGASMDLLDLQYITEKFKETMGIDFPSEEDIKQASVVVAKGPNAKSPAKK